MHLSHLETIPLAPGRKVEFFAIDQSHSCLAVIDEGDFFCFYPEKLDRAVVLKALSSPKRLRGSGTTYTTKVWKKEVQLASPPRTSAFAGGISFDPPQFLFNLVNHSVVTSLSKDIAKLTNATIDAIRAPLHTITRTAVSLCTTFATLCRKVAYYDLSLYFQVTPYLCYFTSQREDYTLRLGIMSQYPGQLPYDPPLSSRLFTAIFPNVTFAQNYPITSFFEAPSPYPPYLSQTLGINTEKPFPPEDQELLCAVLAYNSFPPPQQKLLLSQYPALRELFHAQMILSLI